MGIYDDPPEKQKELCKLYAKNRGMEDEWEDFYQHIQVVKLLGWKQTYHQASIDFFRDSVSFWTELDERGIQVKVYPKRNVSLEKLGKKKPAEDGITGMSKAEHSENYVWHSQSCVVDVEEGLGPRCKMASNFEDSWGPVKKVYDDYIHLFDPGTESALFVLYFLLDWDMEQLAKIFQCSACNISLRLKPVKEKIIAEIKRNKGTNPGPKIKKQVMGNHTI